MTSAILTIAAQFPSLQVWPLRCTGYKIQHYGQNSGHFVSSFVTFVIPTSGPLPAKAGGSAA